MQANPAVDYIIQGEGEEVLAALLAALRDGRPVDSIAGLAWRSRDRIVAGTPQVVDQLDTLPFPYDDADIAEAKDKIIYYESSRGCPFACRYCLSSATAGVRFFELDRVLAELAFFISHDVKQVKFVDRTFNVRREYYWPILRFLAAAECRTNFHFEIAADLLDDDIVTFLQGAPIGRFQFEIGVQSTYEPTLKEICRQNNWPLIVRHVQALRSAGNSHLHLDLIAGLPFEDYRRFGQSFDDVYQLRPHMLQLGFLKLLKGSGVRHEAKKHGYEYMDGAPYEVLANHYLAYGEIRRLKILEELLNQLYNSGRFRTTLEWLVAVYQGEAFLLYDDLTTFWEERDLQRMAHSGRALFRYVADFCITVRPEAGQVCQEFLRFDALLAEQGAIRPEFLTWNGADWTEEKNAFWRDEAKVRKYLPRFRFTTWRELKKHHHIEVFPINIPDYLAEPGEIRQERTAVLFSYDSDKADFQSIAPDDFWLKER
jgi:radical SAM superfamily enzyme YgiQ (UPF0313 family)